MQTVTIGHEWGWLHSNRSGRAHVHEPQLPSGHVLPTGHGMPLDGRTQGPMPASEGCGRTTSVPSVTAFASVCAASFAASGQRGLTADAQLARRIASAHAATVLSF